MTLLKVLHDGSEILVPGTRRGEPLIRAIGQEQLEHESELGLAFTWVSLNADIDINDTILIVRNTDSAFLVMTEIIGHPGNAVADYSINRGNSTTTLAGGTAVTAVNLNGEFVNKTFDYDAHTDETAIADGTDAGHLWVSTTATNRRSLAGHILGKNDFIQINLETETTSGRIELKGFFIPELI